MPLENSKAFKCVCFGSKNADAFRQPNGIENIPHLIRWMRNAQHLSPITYPPEQFDYLTEPTARDETAPFKVEQQLVSTLNRLLSIRLYQRRFRRVCQVTRDVKYRDVAFVPDRDLRIGSHFSLLYRYVPHQFM